MNPAISNLICRSVPTNDRDFKIVGLALIAILVVAIALSEFGLLIGDILGLSASAYLVYGILIFIFAPRLGV